MDFLVRDSDVGGYTPHSIYACTYEPYWQRVRFTCAFKAADDCRASLARLEAYVLLTPRHLTHDIALKRWRVWNLLRSLALGAKDVNQISYFERVSVLLVLEYRKKVKEQLETDGYPFEYDWAVTRAGCNEMWQTAEGSIFLMALRTHLRTYRKLREGVKTELRYFLKILDETRPDES